MKQSVATRFALTNEGKLEYYLGGELEYKDQNTLVLHQRGYIKKLLEHFGMVDCNPKATPLDMDLNLRLLDCPDEVYALLCRITESVQIVDRFFDVFASMMEKTRSW